MLNHYGFGGIFSGWYGVWEILLQTISFWPVLQKKETKILILAPSSSPSTPKQEFSKFAPGGGGRLSQHRDELIATNPQVITSYASFRQDGGIPVKNQYIFDSDVFVMKKCPNQDCSTLTWLWVFRMFKFYWDNWLKIMWENSVYFPNSSFQGFPKAKRISTESGDHCALSTFRHETEKMRCSKNYRLNWNNLPQWVDESKHLYLPN